MGRSLPAPPPGRPGPNQTAPFQRSERIRLRGKDYSQNSVPETSLGRFHAFITTSLPLPLAVTGLTLLRDAGHATVPKVQGGARANRKRPGTVAVPGCFVLPASYAAICLTNGAIVLTSIFRGKAVAATGAVISNTPFTYSAVSFSTFTPSGSASVRSNTP